MAMAIPIPSHIIRQARPRECRCTQSLQQGGAAPDARMMARKGAPGCGGCAPMAGDGGRGTGVDGWSRVAVLVRARTTGVETIVLLTMTL